MKNYNVMGVAKAALEASVRYLAVDLSRRAIRVNAISAGPVNTLSSHGHLGLRGHTRPCGEGEPAPRNVEIEEVANAAVFLLSPLSSGITGEVIYVDCGFNIMGIVWGHEGNHRLAVLPVQAPRWRCVTATWRIPQP